MTTREHLLDPQDPPGVPAQEGPASGLPGPSMTAEAALAIALHEANVECAESAVFDAPRRCDPTGHDLNLRHVSLAAAILAALDGWTLVPSDIVTTTEEECERLEAEIARLRAALLDNAPHIKVCGYPARSCDCYVSLLISHAAPSKP